MSFFQIPVRFFPATLSSAFLALTLTTLPASADSLYKQGNVCENNETPIVETIVIIVPGHALEVTPIHSNGVGGNVYMRRKDDKTLTLGSDRGLQKYVHCMAATQPASNKTEKDRIFDDFDAFCRNERALHVVIDGAHPSDKPMRREDIKNPSAHAPLSQACDEFPKVR